MTHVQSTSDRSNLNTGAALAKVPFHGDTLEATGDGEWAVVKRLCENLGVDVESQRKKLKGEAWPVTAMITATAADGKNYDTFCIHRRSLAMWLATIKPSKVRPEIREKLLAYQREAADVLAAHFSGRSIALPDPAVASLVSVVADLMVEVRSLRGQVAALASCPAPQMVGRATGDNIRARLRTYAALMAPSKREVSRWRMSGTHQLQGAARFSGKGSTWDRLPAADYPIVDRTLDMMIGMAEAVAKRKQMVLLAG